MTAGWLTDPVIEEIVDDITSRGADDWVLAHELRWRLMENARVHGVELADDLDRIDASLVILRRLLIEGWMVARDRPDLFEGEPDPWDDPVTASEEIERAWREVGPQPVVPNLFWLLDTDKGRERGLAKRDEVNKRFNWPPGEVSS